MAEQEHLPVVTIAALYGASGTVIGHRVAVRLGVSLLDRQIPQEAARLARVPEESMKAVSEEPRSWWSRLVHDLGRGSVGSGDVGTQAQGLEQLTRSLRSQLERFLADSARSGGVAMGHGGMVVLRHVPWALHVYLGGPLEERVRVRMREDGIDQETAEHRQRERDRARQAYVRDAYGVDGNDLTLYHLTIDTTALPIDTCVDLIVTAAQARARHLPENGNDRTEHAAGQD